VDKKAFGEIESRLLEVNKVVEKLDASIRVAAFEFLKPYIAGGTITAPKSKVEHGEGDQGGESDSAPTTGDLAGLVDKYGSNDKPSENARLLSAWWFSQHGTAPFSMKCIKETAASTGLTIPSSPAMTFRQATEKGKALYQALGKGGLVKPTVVGESYFRNTYKVKKGTKAPPTTTPKSR
jgi:hypothetical protein